MGRELPSVNSRSDGSFSPIALQKLDIRLSAKMPISTLWQCYRIPPSHIPCGTCCFFIQSVGNKGSHIHQKLELCFPGIICFLSRLAVG